MWQGKWLVLLTTALFPGLGGYYAFVVATPCFRSQVWLAIKLQNSPLPDIESVVSGVTNEEEAINTELLIVRSRELLIQLIDDLDLLNDPEFNDELREPDPLSAAYIKAFVADLIGYDDNLTEEEILLEVVENIDDALLVEAESDTCLYSISVRTEDPGKSADIANQLADIHIRDQVQVKIEATKFVTEWLTERVAELEQEVNNKGNAIQSPRAETELVSSESLEALN